MRNRLLTVLLALSAAGWVACSSSTSPKPTVAGTWHVSGGALSGGRSFTPTAFDVNVTASGDSFLASMPSISVYNGASLVATFDSGSQAIRFADTTQFGFGAYARGASVLCHFIDLYGVKNSGRDTLTSGTAAVFYADTVPGGYCSANLTGSITAHK